MSEYFLGIDFGTGGAKACIIDDEGTVLAYAFREHPIVISQPAWSEHDPELHWEHACAMIRECLEKSGIAPTAVRGVAASSALPSLVMIDSAGRPVNLAYNLMDRRAREQIDWVKQHIGDDRVFAITGNRLEDHPTLVNLMWERDNREENFRRVAKALTVDGYFIHRLTGRSTLHYSGAAFYGVAYNLVERRFEPDVMDAIGIDQALLPELVHCEDIVGEVSRQAAAETGLAPGTPVAGGQVDCNAGWLGAGAVDPGDIQMNLGTCGNFGIIHQHTDFHRAMIAFAYTVGSENTYITAPTTMTGGQCIRYLRDEFSRWEVEQEEKGGAEAYDLLNEQAADVAAGSEGLIVLPFLMGERTPIWDQDARGCIFGLSLHHTKGHLVRAMMEGVAYALYDSFRLISDAGWDLNLPLVLNEGGAKSALWRRIITDVLGVPTVLVARRTGAPFGDALLAGVATGVLPDFSIAKQWAEYAEPMEPDSALHSRYMEYFSVYKRLYEHVKDDYRALAALPR